MLTAMLAATTGAVPLEALALGVATTKAAITTPRVSADTRIVDLGVSAASDVKTITLSLAVRNQAALDAFVASVADPASANFRQFITPQQFAATYGQPAASVALVVSFLKAQGFTVTQVHANNLLVTAKGTNAQIAAAFGTTVHDYTLAGSRYQAPATKPILPAAIAGIATAVSGISTKASFHGHSAVVPRTGVLANDAPGVTTFAGAVGAAPGYYTSLDVAKQYNVNPLYAKGLTGAGKTIGIATLAGYKQSDAYTYWSQLGLTVGANRIVDVSIDGGPSEADGPGSEGSGETTLDVQQSGGLAPGAKIRVYLAPNTDSGFIDVFANAIDENLIDVLSVSWGSGEVFYDQKQLDAYHAIFQQAAAQGIPVIAASGDAGAFDINRSYTYPQCTTLLTVDFPAADSGVLAAGGTTLPNTVQHLHGPVTVTAERAWGWDYLKQYIVSYYGTDLYYSSYYTVGGGGGVSVNVPLPAFQSGLAGVQKSAAGQSMLCDPSFLGIAGTAYVDAIDMPAGVAGRNLPDVSLNADPYSGFVVYQGGWSSGSGGTSFVAPQLNGILTLIASGLPVSSANPHGRVGPINPQLYAAFKKYGYASGSPFRAIKAGTNQYYSATAAYNPATGLGSLDVSALAGALGVP